MSKKDKKEKEREKPKYGIIKCLGYIFSTAFKYRREVPVLLVFQILFNVSNAIFGFYMSPMILSKLEAHSTVGELLLTAAFFIGGCFISDAAIAYIGRGTGANGLKRAYQVELRSRVIEKLSDKLAGTSYCHSLDNEFARAGQKAFSACSNNSGPVEGIWNTMQNLAVSFVMLIFFSAMLTYVNPIVFAVTIIISVIDFAVSSYVYKYNYRHREELPQYFESQTVRPVVPTDDTLELVPLAAKALQRIFRKGYGYKKAGITLSDISSRTGLQTDLFDPVDRARHARLMDAMDAANRTYGRNRVVVAAQGFAPLKMNRQHLSQEYTTDWKQIITVKAD